MKRYKYFILKENMTEKEIHSLFFKFASKIWPQDDFSDINLTVKIEKRYPELMALVRYKDSKSKKLDLVVNPRVFDLSRKDILKLISHEVIHLNITDHNEQFLAMADKVGAAKNELELKSDDNGEHQVFVDTGKDWELLKGFDSKEKAVSFINYSNKNSDSKLTYKKRSK
jgi:hypothetical protein